MDHIGIDSRNGLPQLPREAAHAGDCAPIRAGSWHRRRAITLAKPRTRQEVPALAAPARTKATVSAKRVQRPFLACLWMMGALVALSAMAIAGRELSIELNPFQIALTRSVFCLTVLIPILAVIGFHHVRTAHLRLHLIRNVIHFGGQTGWLYGVALLPLAQVFAIEFTAPIWTAILATLILKEKLTRYRTIAILLGFLGILVVLRPGMAVIQPAALVVLFATFCFASTYVFTRHMTATESPLAIIFYMNLVQLPMGLIPSIPDWTLPSLSLWPWVVMLGLSGLGSHFCFAHAFKHADATVVTPLDFMRLPLIAVVGLTMYGESWDLLILLGGAVIFSGNLLNLWSERGAAAKPPKTMPVSRPASDS
jgi:drug/metabolite transporter (DMT)-like permease